MTWDWGLFWGVIGAVAGVLALIGVVYAVAGYYRDHPKRQLEYTVKTRRLVQATPDLGLEVRAKGIEIADPYLVEFRLRSNSRADIPSNAFDAGKDLLIRVEPGGALVLGDEGARGDIMLTGGDGEGWDWAQFYVGPQLIRRGAALELDFITNGEPVVKVNRPLIDVKILDVSDRPARSDYAWVLGFFGWALFMFVAFVVMPPVLQWGLFTPNAGYWFMVGVTGLLIVVGGFALRAMTRWRRRVGHG